MHPARFGVVGGRTRFLAGLVAISALATFVALPDEPALAKRIVGTNGDDRIVGTAKADRINARGGNDWVNGRRGADRVRGARGKDRIKGARGADRLSAGKGADRVRGARGKDRIKGARGTDRLSAGKGADRLNAVDGKQDGAVNGGPGKDVCTIDQADLPVLKNCEKAVVKNGGQGGGLRVTSASGLTCDSALPLCPFQIVGDQADDLVGLVSGGNGVTLAVGAGVAIAGDTWTAAGLYGCSADGFLKVTIGSKSVRVHITCTS